MAQSKANSYFHHKINFDNYETFHQIRYYIVVDNTAQLNLAPTSSQKSAMIDWLSDHGIPFSGPICKPELYSPIKLHKPWFKIFKVDALLATPSFTCRQIIQILIQLT
jgi:hypothetical protein